MARKIDWDQFDGEAEKMLDFFWDQDREIREIDPQAAADHMKLWASPPVWDRSKEEIKLFNRILRARPGGKWPIRWRW